MKRPRIKALLIAAAAVALWEAIVRIGLVNRIILAAPSDMVLAAAQDGGVFLRAFATTLIEIAAAILIAWTLGIAVGIVAGSSRALAAPTAAVLSSIFAIPLIILYPLLMVWLGIGPLSKVVFGVISGILSDRAQYHRRRARHRAAIPRVRALGRRDAVADLRPHHLSAGAAGDRVGASGRHRPRRHRRGGDRDAGFARRHRLRDLVPSHAVQHRARVLRHGARPAAWRWR